MSDHDLNEFAARIAGPLKPAERLEADFEARVMAGVRRAAREQEPAAASHASEGGWWQRPRTVQLSPLAGLALAAGIACAAVLGTIGAQALRGTGASGAPMVVAAHSPDTVHVVRFVFRDAAARSVALVGDFNGWAKEATPLMQEGVDGTWSASIIVPPGRHEYAFVVSDGEVERWIADPSATRVRDEFGVESSVVTVGGPGGGSSPARPSTS